MTTTASAATDQIISLTDVAYEQVVQMRDASQEGNRLGLRLEIISEPGEDFRYDLSFEVTTKAAFTDEVRTHGELKVIIPAKDVIALGGATLDYSAAQGLVIRNPNSPTAPIAEGLIAGDELSAAVEGLIASSVNPALASHGGFVTFVGHDGEGVAYLTMGGGCHGCSMSRVTMLEGVQRMIVDEIEGIDAVKDLTDHTSGDSPYYQ